MESQDLAKIQRWLREKHEIHIQIDRVYACYQFNVVQYDPEEDANKFIFEGVGVRDLKTYEEALTEGIKLALKHLRSG
jgi:hypothetical protein